MDTNPVIQGSASSQFSPRRAAAPDDGQDYESGGVSSCSVEAADKRATADAGLPPERVLYVVSQFPSLSETFIVREICALIDMGVDVRILSLKPSNESVVQQQAARLMDRVIHPATPWQTMAGALGRAMQSPVAILAFAYRLVTQLWRRPATLAKSAAAVTLALGRAGEIEAFSPQLIHGTWATYPATVAWLLSRVLGCPFSFTSRAHDIFIEDHLMEDKLDAAALAVTITEHNVQFMSRWTPTPGAVSIKVIHSSLNLPEFPFKRDGRHSAKLLSVGRLVPMKGFDVLFAALARLKARGCAFSCTIIGEGPERGRLESLRSTLDLDGVVDLPGAMVQREVAQHMADSALMVLPCVVARNGQSDGIPNVLMEAMASGLPVISTWVSGIPELVEDGVSGCLVQAGDVEGLADAIESLLADTEAQDRFAKAGRAKVERDFNVQIEAARLLDHFRSACHVS